MDIYISTIVVNSETPIGLPVPHIELGVFSKNEMTEEEVLALPEVVTELERFGALQKHTSFQSGPSTIQNENGTFVFNHQWIIIFVSL